MNTAIYDLPLRQQRRRLYAELKAKCSCFGANKRTKQRNGLSLLSIRIGIIGNITILSKPHIENYLSRLSRALSDCVRNTPRRDKNVVTISNRLNIYFDLMAIHLYSRCFSFWLFSSLCLSFAYVPVRKCRWPEFHRDPKLVCTLARWIYFSNLIKTNGKWLPLIGLTTLVCVLCSELAADNMHVRTIHFGVPAHRSGTRESRRCLALNFIFFVN